MCVLYMSTYMSVKGNDMRRTVVKVDVVAYFTE